MTTEFPRTDDLVIDKRETMRRMFHVDPGSDANVLAIKGLHRLIWRKNSRTPVGARGFGSTPNPCFLEIKTFRKADGGDWLIDDFTKDKTLLTGGRLSKSRLMEVADSIDAVFGKGTAALLDTKKTLRLGPDFVQEYIDKRIEESRADAGANRIRHEKNESERQQRELASNILNADKPAGEIKPR